jgi:hypothetical protein
MKPLRIAAWALTLSVLSCTTNDESTPLLREDTRNTEDDAGKPAKPAFADGDCFPCATEQCQDAIARCDADPGCAAYERCLWSCPNTAGGAIAPGCADKCQLADNTASESRSRALRTCIELVDCAVCDAESTSLDTTATPSLDAAPNIDTAQPPDLDAGQPARVDAGPTPNPDTEPPSSLDAASALQTTNGPAASVDAGPAPSAALSCEPTDPSNECNVCTWEKCCDFRAACVATPDCKPFWDCVADCDLEPALCRQECAPQFPEGRWRFDQVLGCASVRCTSECGVPPEPCSRCGFEACGELMVACLEDKPCADIYACVNDNCGPGSDAECIPECTQRSPRGADAYNEYTECGLLNCAAECGG